jgi:hypothetical protein
MSRPVGSGYSERAYNARKAAFELIKRNMINSGVSEKKAEQMAREVAETTDNKRKEEGKE